MATETAGENDKKQISRRDFFRRGINTVLAFVLAGLAGLAMKRSRPGNTVWQINPDKCIQCGGCAIHCVLNPSAVKAVRVYALCGYCELCFGYFQPGASELTAAAENQLCPTGAVKRRLVEDPYYEYVVDESLCIACGKCVKGCNAFGNGALFLQVRHDRCLHCNECSIAKLCPADAFERVPADQPYLLKGG